MNVVLSGERKALSPDEAFGLLGISRGLGYELLRSRQLRSVRAGRRILIPVAAIDEYLAAGKDKAGAPA